MVPSLNNNNNTKPKEENAKPVVPPLSTKPGLLAQLSSTGLKPVDKSTELNTSITTTTPRKEENSGSSTTSKPGLLAQLSSNGVKPIDKSSQVSNNNYNAVTPSPVTSNNMKPGLIAPVSGTGVKPIDKSTEVTNVASRRGPRPDSQSDKPDNTTTNQNEPLITTTGGRGAGIGKSAAGSSATGGGGGAPSSNPRPVTLFVKLGDDKNTPRSGSSPDLDKTEAAAKPGGTSAGRGSGIGNEVNKNVSNNDTKSRPVSVLDSVGKPSLLKGGQLGNQKVTDMSNMFNANNAGVKPNTNIENKKPEETESRRGPRPVSDADKTETAGRAAAGAVTPGRGVGSGVGKVSSSPAGTDNKKDAPPIGKIEEIKNSDSGRSPRPGSDADKSEGAGRAAAAAAPGKGIGSGLGRGNPSTIGAPRPVTVFGKLGEDKPADTGSARGPRPGSDADKSEGAERGAASAPVTPGKGLGSGIGTPSSGASSGAASPATVISPVSDDDIRALSARRKVERGAKTGAMYIPLTKDAETETQDVKGQEEETKPEEPPSWPKDATETQTQDDEARSRKRADTIAQIAAKKEKQAQLKAAIQSKKAAAEAAAQKGDTEESAGVAGSSGTRRQRSMGVRPPPATDNTEQTGEKTNKDETNPPTKPSLTSSVPTPSNKTPPTVAPRADLDSKATAPGSNAKTPPSVTSRTDLGAPGKPDSTKTPPVVNPRTDLPDSKGAESKAPSASNLKPDTGAKQVPPKVNLADNVKPSLTSSAPSTPTKTPTIAAGTDLPDSKAGAGATSTPRATPPTITARADLKDSKGPAATPPTVTPRADLKDRQRNSNTICWYSQKRYRRF